MRVKAQVEVTWGNDLRLELAPSEGGYATEGRLLSG
jgi:hypothetical protein